MRTRMRTRTGTKTGTRKGLLREEARPLRTRTGAGPLNDGLGCVGWGGGGRQQWVHTWWGQDGGAAPPLVFCTMARLDGGTVLSRALLDCSAALPGSSQIQISRVLHHATPAGLQVFELVLRGALLNESLAAVICLRGACQCCGHHWRWRWQAGGWTPSFREYQCGSVLCMLPPLDPPTLLLLSTSTRAWLGSRHPAH